MQIAFNLPHVFNPHASQAENSRVLRILLDTLIAINLAYLENHAVPSLYDSGVVYGRTTLWEPIPALYARGFGDCKSLSAALIAEYRRKGIDCSPVFRWIRRQDNGYRPGETDYHILVHAVPRVSRYQNKDGFEDPSKVLGMGRNENAVR